MAKNTGLSGLTVILNQQCVINISCKQLLSVPQVPTGIAHVFYWYKSSDFYLHSDIGFILKVCKQQGGSASMEDLLYIQ